MSVVLAPRNVLAEFTGKARQLHDAIAAKDEQCGRLISALATRLTDRIRRGNPIPRVDTLVGIASEWQRNMPQRGRLLLEIDLNRRGKSLAIREMRVGASVFQSEEWDTAECGLMVFGTVLEAAPFHFQFRVYSLAHVGLHGLARRLQRGLDDSEAAVLQDLRALGEAHHTLADRPDGADFVVPLEHGGAWRGNVCLVHDSRVGYDKALAARTFVVDGM